MVIRVGLIGLGEVAQLMHLPLLEQDPRFDIAAVMDVSPSLREHVAKRYQVPVQYASAEELLLDERLDAVFILSPDHTHAELLAKAMAAGKHIFIEKPVCLTSSELTPLWPLAERYPKTLFVGYMRRYAKPFLELKRRMPPRESIVHARVRDIICEGPYFIRQSRPVFYPKDVPAQVVEQGRQRTMSRLREAVGEQATPQQLRAYQMLTGLSSHSFSAMRELLGMPARVHSALQHNGEKLVALFDYAHFAVCYEAVISNVARFDAGLEILTDRQRFHLRYDTPYIRNLPISLEITASGDEDTRTEIIGPCYEDPFQSELDAFYACVTEGLIPKTGLVDAAQDLELFSAVARAFCEPTPR